MNNTIEITPLPEGISVQLNRPEKLNAFDRQMIEELTHAFQTISQRTDLRYVVLSGKGSSFCSGADLDWMKGSVNQDYTENMLEARKLYELFEVIDNCQIPVLGKIHGNAFAGGIGLVSVCDIAAAEAGTNFAFSEVKLGIVPAVISGFARKKLNRLKSFELMMTGKRFTAEEARSARLINFVGDMAAVERYIADTIQSLLAAGPEAVKEIRRLLRFMDIHTQAEIKEECIRTIAEIRVSEEGQAGLEAFIAKKSPPWKRSP